MSSKKPRKKIRAQFRKKHDERIRKNDLTRQFEVNAEAMADFQSDERVSGKGHLTRKRTVIGSEDGDDSSGFQFELEIDPERCLAGRVTQVFGLASLVTGEDGREYRCTVRGLLKSLASDLQHVVVAGDFVTIQYDEVGAEAAQAVIVRVESRRNQVSRSSRQRQQIIAANVDQVLIVASAAEPSLKPNLIDRLLVTVGQAGVSPIIVINKADLVPNEDLQPVIGVWSQMGYPVLLTSTQTHQGIDRLQALVKNKTSVVTGQSGVGKSSLLNAIEHGLQLKVGKVSAENQKGTHTTTSAKLIPLKKGGHIIDTPGIRQFQLWDVIADELAGLYRDIRPFINQCRFPNCTHTHEEDCGVKWGVADGKIDVRRYESYCQIRESSESDVSSRMSQKGSQKRESRKAKNNFEDE
jgi:ribosome biogenesis GTPase / thiamine phosphate phosphatase